MDQLRDRLELLFSARLGLYVALQVLDPPRQVGLRLLQLLKLKALDTTQDR